MTGESWGAKVEYQWVDCDREAVSHRYDRIVNLMVLFEWLLFLPRDLRWRAVDRLALSHGGTVLEVGCGTGRNLPYLHQAVGPNGRIYGVDISPRMLTKAFDLRAANHWPNVELHKCDAAEFTAPAPLDGVLFSLSYNTMPHHRAVLRKAWEQLRPGGRLVIMDAKLPPGLGGRLMLPFGLWLMQHTLLGNPLIKPWRELGCIAEHVDMEETLFGSYYICHATKPFGAAKNFRAEDIDANYRIAAE